MTVDKRCGLYMTTRDPFESSDTIELMIHQDHVTTQGI